jgi:hypothetical protein
VPCREQDFTCSRSEPPPTPVIDGGQREVRGLQRPLVSISEFPRKPVCAPVDLPAIGFREPRILYGGFGARIPALPPACRLSAADLTCAF